VSAEWVLAGTAYDVDHFREHIAAIALWLQQIVTGDGVGTVPVFVSFCTPGPLK
jgi:hypothetical protein